MDCRLGIYEKAFPSNMTWEEKFKAANEIGFDFFEISIDETDEKLNRLNMNVTEKESMISLMNKYGIHIETMCLSGHRRFPIGSEEENIRKQAMDIMEKAIVFARDMGIRIIQIAGYDEYYNESNENTKKYFNENIEVSTMIAAKYGVILGFETMETPFMNTVSKAMNYVKKVNSPYLNVYPDTGNITNAAKLYDTDVIQDLKTGKGHIAAVHLKETVQGKYREIPYGKGHVPFKKIIKTSYNMGVRRFLGEFWHDATQDWQTQIKSAYEFIKTAINSTCK